MGYVTGMVTAPRPRAGSLYLDGHGGQKDASPLKVLAPAARPEARSPPRNRYGAKPASDNALNTLSRGPFQRRRFYVRAHPTPSMAASHALVTAHPDACGVSCGFPRALWSVAMTDGLQPLSCGVSVCLNSARVRAFDAVGPCGGALGGGQVGSYCRARMQLYHCLQHFKRRLLGAVRSPCFLSAPRLAAQCFPRSGGVSALRCRGSRTRPANTNTRLPIAALSISL